MSYLENENKLRSISIEDEKISFFCKKCQKWHINELKRETFDNKEMCFNCYYSYTSDFEDKVCENCQQLFEMTGEKGNFDGAFYYCKKCFKKKYSLTKRLVFFFKKTLIKISLKF